MNISKSNATKRFTVPDEINSIVLPDDCDWLILRNMGANDIRLSFEDDENGNYFTIKPSDAPIKARVFSNQINVDGVNGNSILELICWG